MYSEIHMNLKDAKIQWIKNERKPQNLRKMSKPMIITTAIAVSDKHSLSFHSSSTILTQDQALLFSSRWHEYTTRFLSCQLLQGSGIPLGLMNVPTTRRALTVCRRIVDKDKSRDFHPPMNYTSCIHDPTVRYTVLCIVLFRLQDCGSKASNELE